LNPSLEQPALDTLRAEVRRCEADWQRLHDYLNELPETPERPRLPESFGAVKRRLETLYEVWTTLQRLEHTDLRQPSEREKLEACRRSLQDRLASVAVRPRLLQQAARLDHLTRLPSLEAQLMRAAEACDDQELWYEPGRFSLVSKHLRQVEAAFDEARAKDGTLWGLISEEYGHRVSAAAGSFMPPPSPPDLRELARQFDELEDEERDLIRLLEELWSQRPVLSGPGRFNPEAHLNYLKRLPAAAPRSRRALLNFRERFAKNDSMPTILAQSRRYLPEWICKYLDEGITFRSSES
jgi:hypothetical protein